MILQVGNLIIALYRKWIGPIAIAEFMLQWCLTILLLSLLIIPLAIGINGKCACYLDEIALNVISKENSLPSNSL